MTLEERPYVTCRELLDFLYLYLDNDLPQDRRNEFDRHLGVCPACRKYVEEYRDAVRLGKDAFAEDDPAERADPRPPEELVQAILASRRRAT